MNLNYFKEHIEDELSGAKDYIMRAMELKPMNTTWAKHFVDMSAAELGHATTIYDLFNEYYKTLSGSYTEMPDYIEDIKHEITEMYSDCYPKIKIMHEMFMR